MTESTLTKAQEIVRLARATREYVRANKMDDGFNCHYWHSIREWLDTVAPFGQSSKFRRDFLVLAGVAMNPNHPDADVESYFAEVEKLVGGLENV